MSAEIFVMLGAIDFRPEPLDDSVERSLTTIWTPLEFGVYLTVISTQLSRNELPELTNVVIISINIALESLGYTNSTGSIVPKDQKTKDKWKVTPCIVTGYSVVIPTFMRSLKLRTCLEHINRISEPPAKVVVADDGKEHPKQQDVYNEFDNHLNLDVMRLPFNAGLSKKHNKGIEATDTDYILLIDDDHYVPSNIHELVDMLETNETLGGIAPYWEEDGEVMSNATDYKIKDRWAIKGIFEDKELESTGTDKVMYRYDHIANSAMYDCQVFEDYTLDEFYIIEGEDTDFYLKHRDLGTWDFAVAPNYVIRHNPGPGIIDAYADERKDYDKLTDSFDYLAEKFDIKGVFDVDNHLPRKWSQREKLLRFAAVHVVPYSVLWCLRRRKAWERLDDFVRN